MKFTVTVGYTGGRNHEIRSRDAVTEEVSFYDTLEEANDAAMEAWQDIRKASHYSEYLQYYVYVNSGSWEYYDADDEQCEAEDDMEETEAWDRARYEALRRGEAVTAMFDSDNEIRQEYAEEEEEDDD